MSGTVPPVVVLDPCLPFDCSPAAQDDRRNKLKDLYDRLYSGVTSVSDRSRSVTYHDTTTLQKLINGLQQQIALCAGCNGRNQMGRRIFHQAYNKWL
jgi:hypothetical protein